jgi:hypothetical protein
MNKNLNKNMVDKRLAEAILEYKDYICNNTQCIEISFVDNLDDYESINEIDIDGYKFKIGISIIE